MNNLPLIVSKVKEEGLVVEELSPSRLLQYVPKQEGKGGRPSKRKEKNTEDSMPEQNDVDSTLETKDVGAADPAEEMVTDTATTEEDVCIGLTVSILSNIRSKLSPEQIKERLAKKEAEIRVVEPFLTVVTTDGTVLGDGAAEEVVQWEWKDAPNAEGNGKYFD